MNTYFTEALTGAFLLRWIQEKIERTLPTIEIATNTSMAVRTVEDLARRWMPSGKKIASNPTAENRTKRETAITPSSFFREY